MPRSSHNRGTVGRKGSAVAFSGGDTRWIAVLWLLGLSLALSVLFVRPAAADAKAQHVATAKAGFEFCMDRFPETRQTTVLLKDRGWRFLGILGNFRAYTKEKKRVILATATTSAPYQGCFTAVHKMTSQEAANLAVGLLRRARNVKQVQVQDRSNAVEWTATWRGQPVRFAVGKPQNFTILRGAAIVMLAGN